MTRLNKKLLTVFVICSFYSRAFSSQEKGLLVFPPGVLAFYALEELRRRLISGARLDEPIISLCIAALLAFFLCYRQVWRVVFYDYSAFLSGLLRYPYVHFFIRLLAAATAYRCRTASYKKPAAFTKIHDQYRCY